MGWMVQPLVRGRQTALAAATVQAGLPGGGGRRGGAFRPGPAGYSSSPGSEGSTGPFDSAFSSGDGGVGCPRDRDALHLFFWFV
jgi:hypothetical protein